MDLHKIVVAGTAHTFATEEAMMTYINDNSITDYEYWFYMGEQYININPESDGWDRVW